MLFRKPNGLQTPCKQLAVCGRKEGFAEGLMTRDFLYSIGSFLTDAPLAQLDRALDYELLRPTPVSSRLFSVFSRLGPPTSGQEVTAGRKPGANRFLSPNKHGILSHSKTGAAFGYPADDAETMRICRHRRLDGRWGCWIGSDWRGSATGSGTSSYTRTVSGRWDRWPASSSGSTSCLSGTCGNTSP